MWEKRERDSRDAHKIWRLDKIVARIKYKVKVDYQA